MTDDVLRSQSPGKTIKELEKRMERKHLFTRRIQTGKTWLKTRDSVLFLSRGMMLLLAWRQAFHKPWWGDSAQGPERHYNFKLFINSSGAWPGVSLFLVGIRPLGYLLLIFTLENRDPLPDGSLVQTIEGDSGQARRGMIMELGPSAWFGGFFTNHSEGSPAPGLERHCYFVFINHFISVVSPGWPESPFIVDKAFRLPVVWSY